MMASPELFPAHIDDDDDDEVIPLEDLTPPQCAAVSKINSCRAEVLLSRRSLAFLNQIDRVLHKWSVTVKGLEEYRRICR